MGTSIKLHDTKTKSACMHRLRKSFLNVVQHKKHNLDTLQTFSRDWPSNWNFKKTSWKRKRTICVNGPFLKESNKAENCEAGKSAHHDLVIKSDSNSSLKQLTCLKSWFFCNHCKFHTHWSRKLYQRNQHTLIQSRRPPFHHWGRRWWRHYFTISFMAR